MENNITRKKLTEEIKQLESGMSFNLMLSNGDSIEVGHADCWVGGDGCDGWMCAELGNSYYDIAECLTDAIFEYVNGDLDFGIEYIDY